MIVGFGSSYIIRIYKIPLCLLMMIVGNLIDYFLIHIGMILFTLGINLYDFVFGLFPQKVSYQLDVVIHANDIVHFGPKPSWFCFWAFPPQCLIPIGCCYPCLYIHKSSYS